MLRAMQTPADLDADGRHLWTTYFDLRQCEHDANAAYRGVRAALRRQPMTASADDRAALLQSYHNAAATRADVIAARQSAERAYRAYRRVMVVRAHQRSTRQRGTSAVTSQHDRRRPLTN